LAAHHRISVFKKRLETNSCNKNDNENSKRMHDINEPFFSADSLRMRGPFEDWLTGLAP
jgi:hypothetical protein